MNYPGSLHNHTDYSNVSLGFRDSINKLNDLIWRAAELGHDFISISDHEFTGSWVEAEKIEKKVKEKYPNFRVLKGNEIYLVRNDLTQETIKDGEKYYHFLLTAKDYIGAQQLFELSTRAWMRSYVGRGIRRTPTYYSDLEEIIGKNPGHVIGSTACRGSVLGVQLMKYKELTQCFNNLAAEGLYQEIINWCNYLQSIFGKENFYLEFQPSADEEQKYINLETIKLSKALDIPYIITTDSHYLSKDKREIHSAYLNSQDGDRETSKFYATTYLMDTTELEEHLNYLSREELDIAYTNIIQLINSCKDYSILKPLKIPSLKWAEPEVLNIPNKYLELMPTLKTFLNSDFNGDKILAKAIVSKIIKDKTLQNDATYAEIEEELKITWKSSEVNNAHWSAYFLNLQKIIEVVWNSGNIVGCGRGSGVGFLLLYILGITQINPLRETTKTFNWRFLNPDRVSVLDVDCDVSGLRRQEILQAFRDEYGADRVSNVATYGTEKSKAAILTAARGLGIDVDEAQYIASLIPSDRGLTRTLSQCYYGDKDNGFEPILSFITILDREEYKELWKVAQEIEGLKCRVGIHAGGVIFVDEPFYHSCGLMKAPDGTVITQFDLHAAEDVSLIKMDLLSVEAIDKIQICLELIQKNKKEFQNLTIKELYEQEIGIYNLIRTDKKMWEMVWNHEILSLFQMEKQSGIQGIALSKPESVDDLATLNSVIRLMAQEGETETPLEKFARFKKDISLWYEEMDNYGLTKEEQKVLEPVVKISYGLCISQEQFMQLVQLPECGGFNLTWSDSLRKSIAKKNPAAFDKLEEEFFRLTKERGCSQKLCWYVWKVLISMNKGYGFNASHTLAYSLIGLQEMNLAYKFPIVYWNCSNLIVNSGTLENNEINKKDKATDYAKLTNAVNKTIEAGINVSLININTSDLSFEPDEEHNRILYGLKAISGINDEIINKIKENRPYVGIKDFMNRCHLAKVAMINLIKAGAFDEIDKDFDGDRKMIMAYYISQICEPKKRLTLQNFNGLIQHGLIPKELELQIRIFNFTKYLKANKKVGKYFTFDDMCLEFYEKFLSEEQDKLEVINGIVCIKQDSWDKIYKKQMDAARDWLKENQESVLKEYNKQLFLEVWNKYAKGSISHWEMESVCFYYHEHELSKVDMNKYGIRNFDELISNEVDYYFKRGGRDISIYKLSRICGTVLAKDDNRSSITLLTTTGVVNVKFTRDQYAKFKAQLSERLPDNTKIIKEKGWFKRGVLLMITGYRREDDFVCKTYAATQSHSIYKIVEVCGDQIKLQHERWTSADMIEEEDY